MLANARLFDCVLGVSRGFVARRESAMPVQEFAPVAAEQIGVRNLWRTRRAAREIATWLAADQGRLFHGHSRAGLLAGWWLKRMGEQRVVVSVHCYGRQRWFYRRAARQFGERLYWLSPEMKRYYGIADGTSWAQSQPGCIDLAPMRIGRRAASSGLFRIGGAGMLVPWKRWDLVLRAFALLPPQVRARVRFTHIGAVGDDPAAQRYAAALKRRTIAAGLGQIVEWRGEQSTIEPMLRDVDCLVIASDSEPLSMAMLEALRAGVPVLASRSGGNCDVIVEPRNGWLFAPGDAADLARTITRLVETDRRELVDFRRDDLARFDVQTVAACWRQIYEHILAPP
jgi:glycosyltransferase involved in cell wall biosynthesis